MKTFHLFQLLPSDEQQARIEAGDKTLKVAVMKAGLGQIGDAIAHDMYRHVASLTARDEEDVFYKTRSYGGQHWCEGKRIIQGDRNARETGVGDVVVDVENGDAWMCATCGWEALSWDRCAKFIMIAHQLDLRARPAASRQAAPAL